MGSCGPRHVLCKLIETKTEFCEENCFKKIRFFGFFIKKTEKDLKKLTKKRHVGCISKLKTHILAFA